ncbi:hypothetical protein NEDG_00383 [Nematocida displodere]|uniref:Uncharacterized protein n=1 Tax=Nematocida displodere TaxID=1805483 RepID=A0A177EJ62_9MICR|nr:hypothetical protein NEDG_00383 [Nematocida displodere]
MTQPSPPEPLSSLLNDLLSLKDANGEYSEYEEFFSRILKGLNLPEQDIDKLSEVALSHLVARERSAVVVECGMKLIHLLQRSVITPEQVLPVLGLGDVFEIYAAHLLERRRHAALVVGCEEERCTQAHGQWKELLHVGLYSSYILKYSVCQLVIGLMSCKCLRKEIERFLNQTDFPYMVLRLSYFITPTKYSYLVKERIAKLSTFIGSRNVLVSTEASALLSCYKKAFPTDEVRVPHIEAECADTFLRDYFKHLPREEQAEIKNALAQASPTPQNPHATILSLLSNYASFIDTSISQKTVRSITTEDSEPLPDSLYQIELPQRYSEEKTLHHLLTGPPAHLGCYEEA